jgi:hypothetical protein
MKQKVWHSWRKTDYPSDAHLRICAALILTKSVDFGFWSESGVGVFRSVLVHGLKNAVFIFMQATFD